MSNYQKLLQKSYSLNNYPYKKPRRPCSAKQGISILSTADYERIKQNARISAEEEFQNHQKILAQQKNCQLAKAKAHIEQLKQIDKKRPKYPITQGDKEKKNSRKFNFSCGEKGKRRWLGRHKGNGYTIKIRQSRINSRFTKKRTY